MDSTATLPTQKPCFWLELVIVEPSLRLCEHTVFSPARHASGFNSLNFVWFENFYWQKWLFTKCYRCLHASLKFFLFWKILECAWSCCLHWLMEERSIWWYLLNLVSFKIYSSNYSDLEYLWIRSTAPFFSFFFFLNSELPSASRKINWCSVYQCYFCIPGAPVENIKCSWPKGNEQFFDHNCNHAEIQLVTVVRCHWSTRPL